MDGVVQFFREMSLRAKLVAIMASLLAAVVVFVMVYFPSRMEAYSRRSLQTRAEGMAVLLARATAPGVDFEDESSVSEQLSIVSNLPEVVYVGVRSPSGKLLGALHTDLLPADAPPKLDGPVAQFEDRILRVDAPIQGKSGAVGALTLGFSLHELEEEVHDNRIRVTEVCAIVFLLGLLASLGVGTLLVRPIERMTHAALRIAAGDLSQ